MSTEISINSILTDSPSKDLFNSLHFEKLSYSEFLNINSISYQEFINRFPIYNTYREARASGYDAHHIVPVRIQGIPRNSSELDDRCIRCTKVEHILLHYLAARDLGGEYLTIWWHMFMIYKDRAKVEYCCLSQILLDWSSLEIQSKLQTAENNRARFRNMTEDEYSSYCQKVKSEHNTSLAKQHSREGALRRFRNMSKEEHAEYCQNQKKSHNTPEALKHNSDGQKRYWRKLTQEEREDICRKRKEVANRPEVKEAQRRGRAEKLASLSPEELEELRKKRSETAKKRIASCKEKIKETCQNRSKEEKKEISERDSARQHTPQAMAVKEKRREAWKRYKEICTTNNEKPISWNRWASEYSKKYPMRYT